MTTATDTPPVTDPAPAAVFGDPGDIWYHGHGAAGEAGGRLITVETAGGAELGVLPHVVRHSPTGMTWGYGGSGAADCARSLLLAALGDNAKCGTCGGTGRLAWLPGREDEDPVPYDPAVHGEDAETSVCAEIGCDEGWAKVPYQEFKQDYVAGFGETWRLSQAEILNWLAQRGFGSG
jgi:hypothetical protein